MQFKHTFKNLDISDSLRAYSEESFSKISPYLINTFNWQISYSMSKTEYRVEVLVRNPHKHYKVDVCAENLYKAVDLCCEKLEKQFHKTKEQLQNHKKFDLSKQGKLLQINPRLEFTSPMKSKKAA
jgi:putative sigma-54 modulation protein